ncbi:DUF418 domain-containing protein [Sphingomonas glacialis]|nr:DUF418 domain-containing protein [Sphingomonas glacialis]
MATSAPADRIASMDFLRGVAVMGILVANLPGFALPSAYFSPVAWGGSTGANLSVWFATYVLIEGKMRGLFSVLFGASMLLVIERANRKGENAAGVHYRRMATLFVIGAVHLYLFWSGDILNHYAIVGSVAFLFVRLPVRWLLICAGVLLALQLAAENMASQSYFESAARDTPAKIETWNGFASAFGVPPPAEVTAELDARRGGFVESNVYRWKHEVSPLNGIMQLGMQTLSAMLLGMAGYRSGFLTGRWTRARYRRWAAVSLAVSLPIYVALAYNTVAQGFFGPWVFFDSILAAEVPRSVMVIGYTALLMLLMRPGTWVTTRIAAVGRAAFTNYLGTTLMMTFIFSGWGLGQFGYWSRAQLYLLVPVAWAMMLCWSKPWLDRYRYGPLEWVWRSLSRMQLQPMRKLADAIS